MWRAQDVTHHYVKETG